VVLSAGLAYGFATRTEAKTVVDQNVVKQLPLGSATAVCQGTTIGTGDVFTNISTFTPGNAAPGPKDSVSAGFLDGQALPALKPAAPGTRAAADSITLRTLPAGTSGLPVPVPVVIQANGAYAPGFAAGQTVRSDTLQPRGLAATPCTAPGTDFWFAGVSLGTTRASKLELSNTDNAPATVNLTFYGPDGQIDTGTLGHDIVIGAHATVEETLNTYLQPAPAAMTASVHVTTSIGRVATVVLDEDQGQSKTVAGSGMDYIQAQPANAPDQAVQVIPGIPAGGPAGKLQKIDLVLTATGANNVSIDKLEWFGKSPIEPSAPATPPGPGYTPFTLPLTVPAGKTITVDLSFVPADNNESGAFRLTTSGGPLLSGVRIVAAAPQGSLTDTAYLAPGQPITAESVVADNKAGGKATSTLFLSDLGGKGATLKVTTIGADGKPAVDTVQVPANQTAAYPLKANGEFTTVVDVQPGSDPVYAARQMSDSPKSNSVTTTLQVLEPARLTVGVPPVAVDLSGAVKR
jgi:hypothetical protein